MTPPPEPASARPVVIQSPANATIKLVRALRQRRRRQAERAFVVEGRRAVYDALAAGGEPRAMLIRDDVAEAEWQHLAAEHVAAPVHIASTAIFNALSETETPQGILGVFTIPELPLRNTDSPFFLVLDRIRDPGNMGTLLRSAAGAGVTAVVLTDACVDPFNDKAVRAGVGAQFRVPIRYLTPAMQTEIVVTCPVRAVADATAERTYDSVDWTGPAAVIVGSEAVGTSKETVSLATDSIRIPLASGVESLNAAVAGAILMFEVARQRRTSLDSPLA